MMKLYLWVSGMERFGRQFFSEMLHPFVFLSAELLGGCC